MLHKALTDTPCIRYIVHRFKYWKYVFRGFPRSQKKPAPQIYQNLVTKLPSRHKLSPNRQLLPPAAHYQRSTHQHFRTPAPSPYGRTDSAFRTVNFLSFPVNIIIIIIAITQCLSLHCPMYYFLDVSRISGRKRQKVTGRCVTMSAQATAFSLLPNILTCCVAKEVWPRGEGACPVVKRSERERDHSLPSSSEVKNECSYTSTLSPTISWGAQGKTYLTFSKISLRWSNQVGLSGHST